MGYLARIVYFLVAPFVLVVISQLLPISGMILDLIITLAVFLFVERLEHASLGGMPLARILERRMRFRDYYRENPPRWFLYYALYPLLFPYWLFHRKARQEFLLYRGYTVLSLVLLVITNLVHYFRFWWPDIPFGRFVPSVFALLLMQLLIVMMFLMPIATTVVSYKLQGRAWALRGLALVALLGVGLAYLGISSWRQSHPPLLVSDRAYRRAEALPERALEVKQAALLAAQRALTPKDIEPDGLILGETLSTARHTMTTFFREDEVTCFFLWTPSPDNPELLVLFFMKGARLRDWLGLRADGQWVTEEEVLPAGALQAMESASKS